MSCNTSLKVTLGGVLRVPSQKMALRETTVRYAVSKIFKFLIQNSIFILGKMYFFSKASSSNLLIQDSVFCVIYFDTPWIWYCLLPCLFPFIIYLFTYLFVGCVVWFAQLKPNKRFLATIFHFLRYDTNLVWRWWTRTWYNVTSFTQQLKHERRS